MRRRWLVRASVALASLTVLLVVGEIGARLAGLEPFAYEPPGFRIEPGDKLTQPHPVLGYAHVPGAFEVVFGDGAFRFHMTHGGDSLRVTRAPGFHAEGKPGLWFLGCSFTHGWGVSDEDTYAWKVQSALPERDVVNFGVSGYGTLHSYLQLKEGLSTRPTPKTVVLAYAGSHEERNTFLRYRRKALAAWVSHGTLDQPYARLDGAGELVLAPPTPALYPGLWLTRYSALLNWLDDSLNRNEAAYAEAHRVTMALIEDIRDLCAAKGIEFIVAGIAVGEYAQGTLRECRLRLGVPTVELGVDLTIPGNSNLPYDGHPSAAVHSVYAERLVSFLGGRRELPTVFQARLDETHVERGARLGLDLAWQANGLARDYGVLVHFLDESGRTAFKDNHLPPVPASRWSGPTSDRREVVVPFSAHPGTYEVWVGLGEPGKDLMPLTPGPGVSRDLLNRHRVAEFTVE